MVIIRKEQEDNTAAGGNRMDVLYDSTGKDKLHSYL
jgi:hypothetical protein